MASPDSFSIDQREFERVRAMSSYLHQMMEAASEAGSGKLHFRWLKTVPTRPSFADVVFGCRNKVYAVIASCVVEKSVEGGGIELAVTVDAVRRDLLIGESIRNGLVPAMFPMWPDTLRPLHGDWNLLALPEGGLFDPVAASGDEPVPLSAWELNNLAVQTVVTHLRERGRHIYSAQDVMGFYPQIWFEDADGNRAWAIAFADTTPNLDATEPIAAKELPQRLAPSAGYIARVGIRSAEVGNKAPCRGDGLFLAFEGLRRA